MLAIGVLLPELSSGSCHPLGRQGSCLPTAIAERRLPPQRQDLKAQPTRCGCTTVRGRPTGSVKKSGAP